MSLPEAVSAGSSHLTTLTCVVSVGVPFSSLALPGVNSVGLSLTGPRSVGLLLVEAISIDADSSASVESSHIVSVGLAEEGPPVTAISRGGCSNSTGCSSGSAGNTGNISGIIAAASSGLTHLETVVDDGQDAWSLTDVFTISRNGSRCSFTTGVACLVHFGKGSSSSDELDNDNDVEDDDELDVDFDEAPKVTLGD